MTPLLAIRAWTRFLLQLCIPSGRFAARGGLYFLPHGATEPPGSLPRAPQKPDTGFYFRGPVLVLLDTSEPKFNTETAALV